AVLLDVESAGTLLAGLPHKVIAARLPIEREGQSSLVLGSDLRFWAAAGKLALDLLVRQRYLPSIIEAQTVPYYGYSSSSRGPHIASYWEAALGDAEVRGSFETLAGAMPDLCRAAPPPDVPDAAGAEPAGARALLEDFLHAVVSARAGTWLARDAHLLQVPSETHSTYGVRSSHSYYGYGSGYGYGFYGTPTQQWVRGLAAPGRVLSVEGHDVKTLLDGVKRWHAGLTGAGSATFRLCFRLSPPDAPAATDPTSDISNGPVAGNPPAAAPPLSDTGNSPLSDTGNSPVGALPAAPAAGENSVAAADESWRLDYFIQARDDLSLLVPLEAVWQERSPIAQFVDRRFEHPH
ncbi:MAG: hypothetical protein ACRDHP_13555, partial [Ktedonobacterales bacterium]